MQLKRYFRMVAVIAGVATALAYLAIANSYS